MRASSLALRLFFSAAAWTVVMLVVAGIVLSSLYRAAVERAFDRRLNVYLRTLVADVATPDCHYHTTFGAPVNTTLQLYQGAWTVPSSLSQTSPPAR